MRNKLRIPLIMNIFNTTPGLLKEFTGCDIEDIFDKEYEHIKGYWESIPDLRLGQALFNLGLLNNDSSYHKEEDDWLIGKGVLKFENIKFWGSNLDKDGNVLPHTIWKVLSALNDDHIKAILKMQIKINDKYREYFESRVKTIKV